MIIRTKNIQYIQAIETELQHKENEKKKLISTNNDLIKKIDDYENTITISIDNEAKLLSQITDLDRYHHYYYYHYHYHYYYYCHHHYYYHYHHFH